MTDFLNHLFHEFHLPLQNPVLIFSLVLFIILLSPILLSKLNIPGIIGLILSGVAIGPFGFNILAKTSAIDLFSTIGLLYIMFIAGLELDLNQFKINRNKSLVFGFLTFIIPLSIGFPVCHYFLGFNLQASLLTASMFATHTLVAYPIVSKLGISKNQAVAVAVGGTILTDTAVLILLAVIIGSHNGSLNQEFWIRLIVSLSIFSGIMFLIIPRIAKWFFRKLESEKHSHYIFVLSVVFFSAFLAEVAGVEPIIGAFVAGLSLNKLIPHSSALMNRVEFIGNSLFIPFFLISVGMLVNVRVIFQGNNALIVAVTLTAVAIGSKWIAAYLTRKIYHFTKAEGSIIFGLSGAHAAATLAVILVGYNAGILNEYVLNGTIILILITCVVASFVSEKAAKKILIEQETDSGTSLSANEAHIDEIIVIPSIEISSLDKLLNFSIFIKSPHSEQAISILTVVPDDLISESKIKKMRSDLENNLSEAVASEVNINFITAIDHNVASGIVRKSREVLADAIVLTWPKRQGLLDRLLGDNFDRIIAGFSRTLLFCSFTRPFSSFDQVVVVVSPLAEFEVGFSAWLKNVQNLTNQLSLPLVFYCNENSEDSIKKFFAQNRLKSKFKNFELLELDDFELLKDSIQKSDLLIFISSRKGAASYKSTMDQFPEKIEKHFPKNDRVVIYPNQYEQGATALSNINYTMKPMQKKIEGFQRFFGSIFKKRDS
jgi:Kef-type K+ transport system membrane component KefB|tara:strand:- start:37085 stop:39232 length:2148 start_codon:yes stop_codon:yes gene_type:complete